MLKRILLGALAILIAGSGYLYFAYLRPIESFQPTGPYHIGATNFDYTFESDINQDSRKLNIRVWYPTDATSGEINPVSSLDAGVAILKIFRLPEALAKEEDSLAFKDAPIVIGSEILPVVIFNHGFGSIAEQNTVNMQELASNGYVVFSLSHPGSSVLTEYSDGSSVNYDATHPAYLDFADIKQYSKNMSNSVSSTIEKFAIADGFDEYWSLIRAMAQSPAYANMQPILLEWIEDTNAVVDAIAEEQFDQFPADIANRIVGAKIGTMGHSLGGMTAIGASLTNHYIDAVLDLDAPLTLDISAEQAVLRAPTCFLMSDKIDLDGGPIDMGDLNVPLIENSGQPGCNVIFTGARHMNFGDLNYVSFMKLMPILGPVDQADFGVELNHVMLNFFDRYLKGDDVGYTPIFDKIITYQEF